ncbi:MAG: hypothetical protein ACRDDF_00090, partial [Aeromonas sp.]
SDQTDNPLYSSVVGGIGHSPMTSVGWTLLDQSILDTRTDRMKPQRTEQRHALCLLACQIAALHSVVRTFIQFRNA